MFRRFASFELSLPLLAVFVVTAYLVVSLPAATHKASVAAIAASYVAFIVWLSGQSRELRLTLFFSQVAVLVGVYGAELYAANRKYESSSLIGQARKLSTANEQAWPAIPPSTWYFGLFRNDIDAGRTLLPLAGMSKVKSVLCIEAEGWVTFTADRSGFRNPPRPEPGPGGAESVDILMIGDSFAEGSCVPDNSTLAAHLRRLGASVLNLGMHGSGPLFELAILREYGERPTFKRLLWVFFEGNDIYDLSRENESAMLRRYLVEGGLQKLEDRQAEVDAAIRAGLQGRDDRFTWADVARLKELRAALGITGVGRGGDLKPSVTPQLPALAEVWDRARRFAETKGAVMTILYVPTPTRFQNSSDATYFSAMEQAVRTLACRANIDFISLTGPLERGGKLPLDHYAAMSGRYGHFTDAGYRLAAETVQRRIAGQVPADCPTR